MKKSIVLTIIVPVLMFFNSSEAAQPGLLRTEFIYEKAPFAQCHASTLVETPNGLVAAWFGGPREGNAQVGIWVSRQIAGKWTNPVEVANGMPEDGRGKRYPCWNPVLSQPRTGSLLLFYKVGPSPSRWWGEVKTSQDQGQTWSPARRLPKGILGPIKNKPIQLPNSDLLAGSSTEAVLTDRWRVHFERSNDGGRTWTATSDVDPGTQKIDAIQPSLLVHKDGRIQALGRTRSRRIFETWSRDGGKTWGPMALTALPNPNSGIDAVTLTDGRHLLIYNHTTRGRTPLNIAVSEDGKNWKAALVLEKEPGEYSYPAIIQTSDGLVHATYTWKRVRIKHAVVDPKQLAPRDLMDFNDKNP
jgi:predicted neuraminidase